MKENQKIGFSYFDLFKVWLFANLILASLFTTLATIATKYTHDGLYDAEMILGIIIYGFIVTIPSLVLLLISKYFYTSKFSSVNPNYFFTIIIILINLGYLLITVIKDAQLIYLLGYLVSTFAGILSLKIVTKSNCIARKKCE